MRHLKSGRKLNRTSSHRKSLMSNLSCSLIEHKHIITTLPKAKEVRKYIDRLITYAKKNNLHGRRLILRKIKGSNKKEIANILMHDIAPNYKNRNGGYTRIVKINNRKNDNAKLSILEFVDFNSNKLTNSSSADKDIIDKKEEKK